MATVTVKQNKDQKIVLKLDHGDMVDFCAVLSYMVDQYCVLSTDKSLSRAATYEDVRELLYEALLLDVYNRLIKQHDCPLRERYLPSEAYTVKLNKAEALVFWAAVNPIGILRTGRPAIDTILFHLHKMLS